MKMFKSYYHKNILKTSGFLWASKSCDFIQGFVLNNNCLEEHQYTVSSFVFFLKKPSIKNKAKKNHENYLIDNRAKKNEAINLLGF